MSGRDLTRRLACYRIRGRMTKSDQRVRHAVHVAVLERRLPPRLCELTLDERADGREGTGSSAMPWRPWDKELLPIEVDEYVGLDQQLVVVLQPTMEE